MTHLVSDLDALTSPAGQQHLVSHLYRHWLHGSLLVGCSGSSSDDAGLGQGRASGRRGQKETSGRLLCGLEPLQQHSVQEWLDAGDGSDS